MEKTWTQDKVVYQIYPKSFQDTTGNGTGDLQGIISHLDYLHFLGVDILWLTPVYPSPQVDNGYDVADYCAIDPRYGTMADFDQLVAEAHQRNLKVMMDMVFNHTSTQHPWFIQACDPQSPYHPYYIWRDSPPDIPPTNWQSKFGGPAWQWQPECGQHYLHLFSKEQADLNWEYPPVREALKDVCRFWAARGVDALRLDVVNLISKPEQFGDDPDGDGRRFYTDGPRAHEFLQEMNRDVFRPLNLITVGEMSSTSLQHCQQYASCDNTELSMVFNFHHLKIDYANGDKWTRMAPDFIALKKIFALWQSGMHQRANGALFWCNHDQPRVVSRLGNEGVYREISAKMLAMVLYGMQGTPYLYQGEEIGMTNAGFTDLRQYRDVESLNIARILRRQGHSQEDILAILGAKSRDNSRTPMQWDDTKHAGFTTGTPWLDCNVNHRQINVAEALRDPHSVLYCYRSLIRLRKQLTLLQYGDYHDLAPDRPDIWCYCRCWQGYLLLVVANLTDIPCDWQPPVFEQEGTYSLIISNTPETPRIPRPGQLSPYQAAWWLFTPGPSAGH